MACLKEYLHLLVMLQFMIIRKDSHTISDIIANIEKKFATGTNPLYFAKTWKLMCMISSYLVDSIHVGRIDPVKDLRLFGRKIMHPVFFSKKKVNRFLSFKKTIKKRVHSPTDGSSVCFFRVSYLRFWVWICANNALELADVIKARGSAEEGNSHDKKRLPRIARIQCHGAWQCCA